MLRRQSDWRPNYDQYGYIDFPVGSQDLTPFIPLIAGDSLRCSTFTGRHLLMFSGDRVALARRLLRSYLK